MTVIDSESPRSEDVLVVADAAPGAGLGHVTRSSAVAAGLRARGLRCRCVAVGTDRPTHAGVDWQPVAGDKDIPRTAPSLLLLDSYALDPAAVRAHVLPQRMAVMHDVGPIPADTDLVVTTDPGLVGSRPNVVGGLTMSCLGPRFWGLPAPGDVALEIDRVLVTTGGGDPGGHAVPVAMAVREALPRAEVILVRGPQARFPDPDGIHLLDRPESLFAALTSVDLSVTSAGSSLLEALAIGTPALALLVAGNQRAKAQTLASRGATQLFEPDQLLDLTAAIRELNSNRELRHARIQRGREAVDGYGALRVAYALWRLVTDESTGPR